MHAKDPRSASPIPVPHSSLVTSGVGGSASKIVRREGFGRPLALGCELRGADGADADDGRRGVADLRAEQVGVGFLLLRSTFCSPDRDRADSS